jgi:methylated-DNA-[protein]-cysteine S-methyltransferase
MKAFADRFTSPLGEMLAAVNERGAVVRVEFLPNRSRDDMLARLIHDGFTVAWDVKACGTVIQQLHEYFSRDRRHFELGLEPKGSPFQRRVWDELLKIPYGITISYKELASRIGNPKAVRAVGRANAANPIAIIIPCHRIIGSDQALTGYGGGLAIKQALLSHEGALLF